MQNCFGLPLHIELIGMHWKISPKNLRQTVGNDESAQANQGAVEPCLGKKFDGKGTGLIA